MLERVLSQDSKTANPYIALFVNGDEENPNVISAVIFSRNLEHEDNNAQLAYEFLDLASPHLSDIDFEADNNLRILTDTVLNVIDTDTQSDHENVATVFATLPFFGLEDFRRKRLIQQLLFSIAENWSLRLRENIAYMNEMHTFEIDPLLYTVAFTVHRKLKNLFGDLFRENSFILMNEEVCHTNGPHIDLFLNRNIPSYTVISVGKTHKYYIPGLSSTLVGEFKGLYAKKPIVKRKYLRFAAGKIS